MPDPIKRHEALQNLSRDHHEGLLLCFKIRQGLKRNVDPQRIMAYVRHFYGQNLTEHFRLEEEILFPVLGNEHPMVKIALEQHGQLRELFKDENPSTENLEQIERDLKTHIRFEERQLFNEFQDQIGEEKLQELHRKLEQSPAPGDDAWEDHFWA